MCDIEHDIEEGLILKIHCPTLIVHSRNDNSVSFEHAKHSNRSIKDSQLEIINNEWGHLFWIGKDSNIPIEKIIEFMQQNHHRQYTEK